MPSSSTPSATKKLVRIAFYSKPDAGTVERECAPLGYGPAAGEADPLNRYLIWDPANTAGPNPLALSPDQIVSVNVLGKDFTPETYRAPSAAVTPQSQTGP